MGRARRARALSAGLKRLLLVACGYALCYLVATWPLLLSPSTKIPVNHADGFFDLLLFWYARTGELWSSHTDLLFYPNGVDLPADQGYWLVPALSVPLQWIFPLPLVYNILAMALVVATGTTAFVLARETGAGDYASFVAGGLLLLSPPYLDEFTQGIPENFGMQWLLLYLLFLLRGKPGWALAFLILSGLGSWYLGAFALIFTAILLTGRFSVRATLVTALLFVCALGVAVQTSTPGYNSVLARAILRGEIEVPDMHEMPLRMTDHDLAAKTTWGVLVDSADFGGLLARHRPSALKDNLPGLLLLGLALLGATLGRAPLRWTLAAVLFLALSTGPQLIFNGTPWPSPLGWLYDAIPALSAVRPVRFLLAACLALSVVAAHGLPRLATPGANVLLTIGLLALGALEVWVVHVAHYRISLSSAVVPSFYTSLRARPPTEAVIDVPFLPATIQTGQALYFQTVHVHPMLNYDFVRPASMSGLAAMGRSNSVIRLLLTGRGAPDRAGIEALAGMGFRHLVLHAEVATTAFDPDRVTLFKAAVFDALRAAYGEPTAYADGILVFSLAVPARPLASFRSEVLLGPRTVVRESESVLASIPKGATEVRVWVRGRGARLAAYRRGREVAVGAPTGDGWHWQRLKLPTEGGPMEVRLILPPDLPGALIEDLSAWRPEANG